LGIAKFNTDQHNDAITYLNLAAEYRKNDPEVYLYRARYFLLYNKPEAAREELSAGLAVDSLNTEVLYELGVLDYKEEKFGKSNKYFQKIIRIAPQYWPAYRYLGFLAEKDNKLLKAQEYYNLYLKNITVEDTEVLRRLENLSSHLKKN
jgi:tetratricopeptide (TPR) repeat protein